MTCNHIILALLWFIYCILHSALASRPVKQKLQQKLTKNYKYYRIFYTVFSFVFLAAVIWFQISMATIQLFQLTSWMLLAGAVISFFGLTLMLVCIKKYFFNLSGLRSLIEENNSGALIVSGVHKYVRHPLYLGTFAFIWGLFLLLPYLSLLIANTIITIYTLIGIELEEKKLIAEFGDRYVQYRKKVPKLIPLLKAKRKA